MKKLRNNQEDFIASLYQRGILHVLEKIILEFPDKTISECKKVSRTWIRIVNHFQKSKNPRILKYRDVKLARAWREKKFTLRSKDMGLVAMVPGALLCHDMIADDKHIVIQATSMPTQTRCVLVYNTSTLALQTIFYPNVQSLPIPGLYSIVCMTMDDKYLYTYVKALELTECLMWDRSQNFALVCKAPMRNLFSHRNCLPSHSIANTPYVHKGLVYLPVGSTIDPRKMIWNLVDMETIEEIGKTEKVFQANIYHELKDGSGNFFVLQPDNDLQFYLSSEMKDYQWSRRVDGRSPSILGYDKDYVAIAWEMLELINGRQVPISLDFFVERS